MKFYLIALLFFFSLSQAFSADLSRSKFQDKKIKFRGGQIFELDSNKNKLLFTIKADLKKLKKDIVVFISSYIDTDKNEVMTEEAQFQKFDLQKYIIKQHQLNEVYELSIVGDKMHFYKTKAGEMEEKTKILPPNLIVGPSFVPFLQKNWTDLQDKKIIEAELAVLDYMSTFSFEFEKLRDEKHEGQDVVIVRMKPANTLVSSVVRPVYFIMKNDGSQILEIKGRMLPKRKIGSRWEDFEGEAVFSY